jgi:predicted glutamine amidotransferase
MRKAKTYPFTAFVLALALLSQVAGPVLAAAQPGEVGLAAEDHNCRFWGIISTDVPAAVIQDHLVNLPNSIENLSPANPDGWSVGYYPDGNPVPVVNRGYPPAYNDPNFDAAVDEAALATPRIAVSHIRNTSSGITPASGDPHPFERVKDGRHWLMGHNGTIDKDVLLDLIRPDYFAANPPLYGSNQSEWIDSDLYQIFVLQTLEDFNFQVKPAHPQAA